MTSATPDDAESCDKGSIAGHTGLFRFPSHADLLHFPELPTGPVRAADKGSAVDAIIVPTIRGAEQLRPAADLAAQLRCPLIAIYSRRSSEELSSVHAEFKHRSVTVIDLPARFPQKLQDLLAFDTNSHREGASYCPLDISRKRNLGLLLAKLCGWTKILFLDDDIRQLSAREMIRAASLLEEYPIVSFQVRNFPDNSVIGHAKRLAGWQQDVFVSGGSLLVDPQRLDGFFPPVYHEDWLCAFNHIYPRAVAVAGEVEQLAYTPFATPLRAWLEEFGDVLGEGLLWLVHQKTERSLAQAWFWNAAQNPSFWRSALQQRAMLLDEIARRLLKHPQDGDIAAALVSIKEAQIRRTELAAEDFVSFVRQWLGDLAAWRARLSGLSRVDSVANALAELGLSHFVRFPEADPWEWRLTDVRRRLAQLRTVPSALTQDSLDQKVRSVLGQDGRLRDRLIQLRKSAGQDRGSRLGGVEHGRGPGRRIERPSAGGDHGEEHDGAAAGGEQQPGGVTGRNEPGPERAVQAGGQDRAGDGHAE